MIMEKVSKKSNCLDPLALDVRTSQDWEQGCRAPDLAARVMLTVIMRRSTSGEKVGRRTPSSVCTGRLLGQSMGYRYLETAGAKCSHRAVLYACVFDRFPIRPFTPPISIHPNPYI